MPSRRLTSEEAATADRLLTQFKEAIETEAAGDPVLLFALRRRISARLVYWERSTPGERTKLKAQQWQSQDGLCAICGLAMEQKGSELDRADPVVGYTAENTRLVHHDCHVADQQAKRFS